MLKDKDLEEFKEYIYDTFDKRDVIEDIVIPLFRRELTPSEIVEKCIDDLEEDLKEVENGMPYVDDHIKEFHNLSKKLIILHR